MPFLKNSALKFKRRISSELYLKAPTNQSKADDPWQESEEPYRVYSSEELQAVLQANKAKSRLTLPWRIVVSQVTATLLGALIACIFWDGGRISVYTYSVFFGGLICVLPAVLFLLRLEIARGAQHRTPGSFLSALVSGEVIKITATIAMFIWLAFYYADLKWIPLLLTYFVTLKCYLLGLFWR